MLRVRLRIQRLRRILKPSWRAYDTHGLKARSAPRPERSPSCAASGADRTHCSALLTNYAYGLMRSHGERAANCWNGFKNAIPMNIRTNCCALSRDELRSGGEKKHMS